MSLELDHLVVGASSLGQGQRWAWERLGLQPVGGGRHPLMGTHNLVVRLTDGLGGDRYLEIIAVDPRAPDPGRPRWFGLDSAPVQAALFEGPRLLAWVARSDAIDVDRERMVVSGSDPGPLLSASREAPGGPFRWRITVAPDGSRVAGGAVPLLIAWEGRRPTAFLVPSTISLERIVVRGLAADAAAMCASAGVDTAEGEGPALEAVLLTPNGRVELESV
jgi:hypothetical protein